MAYDSPLSAFEGEVIPDVASFKEEFLQGIEIRFVVPAHFMLLYAISKGKNFKDSFS